MRTTLDIADDVLQAAKERAKRERKTVGEMISELARRALTTREPLAVKEPTAVYGLTPFARRGGIVANELIDKLRDEDAYETRPPRRAPARSIPPQVGLQSADFNKCAHYIPACSSGSA